jgi:sigma-B regulation protein RsbU (phosphoserine phosphatase)
MTMGISRAICAPVRVADTIAGFAYADARDPGRWRGEEVTFCAAVADLCGLALANLRRSALELRQAKLLRDLSVARDVQSRLTPAGSGAVGALTYAAHTSAGRHVAGDFFSITPIDDARTAVLLGDVSGKGLGAGLLMAIVQSHLEALLISGHDLDAAVTRLNRYVATKSATQEFATLLAAIVDVRTGEMSCVDAGHGLGFVCDRENCWTAIDVRGGVPVGAVSDTQYTVERVELPPGGRLVMLSDGVREQTNAEGEEFGPRRVLEALGRSGSVEADVREVLNDLVAFAEGRRFDDDVSIASIRVDH